MNYSQVYKNCYDAVKANGKDGEYQIQFISHGGIGNISCKLENFTLFSIIHHNSTPDNFINGKVLHYVNIAYPNFQKEDLNSFKKIMNYNCYQSMNYTAKAVNISYIRFTFWDDIEIPLDSSIDGICKCLIREECDKTNLTGSSCKAQGSIGDNSQQTDIGKFSVNPKRLPVKVMKFGDTDHIHEHIYYTLYDFICEEKFLPKVTSLDSSKFCSKDWNLLFDFNLDSCIQLKGNQILLKLEFPIKIDKITIKSNEENCKHLNIFAKNFNDITNHKLCKEDESKKCNFKFQFPAVEILILSVNKNEITLCELYFEYLYSSY